MSATTPALAQVQQRVSGLAERVKRFIYRGAARSCPICGSDVRAFLPFGRPPRADARCPVCGAVERHRLAWLYFQRRTDLFTSTAADRRVLHVAPEPWFESRLKRLLGGSYLTADLFNPAMIKMDIMAIDQPDASFDVIYCSHVLEHVKDDKLAMRELCRVLKPSGWAILLVPIIATHSHEDPNVTDPKERHRLYGRKNHLRAYGPDYADRLRECGFEVQVTTPEELCTADEVKRFALTAGAGQIHFCRRAP